MVKQLDKQDCLAIIEPYQDEPAEADMKLMLKKHGNRIYRGRMSDRVFAQIHPVRKTHLCPPNPMYVFDTSGFEWGLEFRDVETGSLIRHGGVWPTISQAREEAETINPVDFA